MPGIYTSLHHSLFTIHTSTVRLVLFDIDGTLVNVQRELTRRILIDAATRALGYSKPFEIPSHYRFHGRTDRGIFIDVAAMMEIEREAALEAVVHFEELLLGGWDHGLTQETVRVLPGIFTLLDRLAGDPDVTLGLLTGNLERGARSKLHPHNMNRFFPFGAYGSDAIERNDLPPIALERANGTIVREGSRFSFDHAVIIGDSHRDVECAHAWGIRALAVATGGLTVDDLRAHNPEGLMETLEDVDEVIRFIHSK